MVQEMQDELIVEICILSENGASYSLTNLLPILFSRRALPEDINNNETIQLKRTLFALSALGREREKSLQETG
jgi:hypothetical protein